MFQIPVQNLDNIRKVRKRVKGILVDIGLDSCKELMKDLKSFDPGEKYFYNTSWGDVSPWEPSGKKARYRTKPYCCSLCRYSTKVLTSLKNHLGKKRLSMDYSNRGFQLDLDANGNLLFPHLDFITILPREKLGEREVYLAILAGIHSKSLVPVYVKVRPQPEVAPKIPNKQKLTCPFCLSTFMTADAYELHLKERHHVMPTVHTMLRSPAFKCIHCCGVYTGNMTLGAIAVHLLRCRSAPKDSSSDLQVQPGFIESSELLMVNGDVIPESTFPVKRKLPEGHLGPEDQRDGEEPQLTLDADASSGSEKGLGAVPLKRQKSEIRTEGSGPSEDSLQALALDPSKYEGRSYEEKKQFLRDYFHRRPYPSRKEVELLSSLLWVLICLNLKMSNTD